MTRRKSGPQSPRGRKAKGNLGEREVKALLTSHGIKVLDGQMSEPGCDLVLNPQAVVEVKNCSWSSIGGVDRARLLAAAEGFRARGIAHWVVILEPYQGPNGGARLCIIARRESGRIGLVFNQQLHSPGTGNTPLPPGFPKALGTAATEGKEA